MFETDMPLSMQLKKKMSWLILLLGLLPFLWLFMTIDDWKRDFTTNFAQTSEDAEQPTLRPLRTELSAEEAADAIANWVQSENRWEIADRKRDVDGNLTLHLVRTTPLMRFKDDIHVAVATDSVNPNMTLVSATSQSRVGKGDLGQNPRNLKELMRGIAPAL